MHGESLAYAENESSPDTVVTGRKSARDQNSEPATLANAKIMMVDDEPITMEVIQTFLEDAGFENFVMTEFSTEALGLLEKERPDVLLLDLMMPEVSGFDILGAMRTDEVLKHIPVIVLTSSVDAETKLKALEMEATDFLAKPVDPSELALRLRNTLAAKAYRDQLAYYDALTGLPNRRMFLERLDWALKAARRNGAIAAVLHMGLNRFKQINDTLGPRVGDELLVGVAGRLEECIRASDQLGMAAPDDSWRNLSRLGGDEFSVLLPDVSHVEDAGVVAQRILKAMDEPFRVDGDEIFVTPSIGIAAYPDDGGSCDVIIKHAGSAMHYAKETGASTYQFYAKDLNARSLERLTLENQLRKALERNELLLHYQPKLELASGRMLGVEALLRWRHPDLGLVGPDRFIPIAEETDLIIPIGEWVLREACRQLLAWRSEGLASLNVAVNVSAKQLRDGALVDVVRNVVSGSGLSPDTLTLELTESVLMENAESNVRTLNDIKAMGLKLSMDDFGTGFSSLSYLKRFPLDELKIDRGFVADVDTDTDNAAIVGAVVAMAHRLGLGVTAEGVEREQERAFLEACNCDQWQGFLFSRAVAAEAIPGLHNPAGSVLKST